MPLTRQILAIAGKDTYPDLGVFAASATDRLRARAAPGRWCGWVRRSGAGVRAGQDRPGWLHQRDLHGAPIGMTDGPAVWVIRLYPPDPGWASVFLGG